MNHSLNYSENIAHNLLEFLKERFNVFQIDVFIKF